MFFPPSSPYKANYNYRLHGKKSETRSCLPPPPLSQQRKLTATSLYRLFPYEVCVSALAVIFIVVILVLIANRMLLPGIVMIGSFMLFILWLTGMVETAIQLFGPQGSVNGMCNTYVTGQEFSGVSVGTLAWLEQRSICAYPIPVHRKFSRELHADRLSKLGQSWQAAFAFEVIGTVFLFWMMIMAYKVNQDDYE